MAKLLKLRRGTTSQHNTFTGAEGEVTIDTTKDTAVVHDGSTAGGRPLAREDMSNVSSSSIAGRLGADSIATTKIAAGTLPSDVKITDSNVSGNLTITSADIVNGTIVNADIASNAAIAGTKLENSGVTAGQYGSSSAIPIVTVDAQGLVTAASTTAVDSTKIQNGTTEVATANAGNITMKRSGTTRLVVDNAGVDVTGTLDVAGNTTIDNGTNTTFSVKCDDAGVALIRANGDGQGTGALEVGQSDNYGGGIAYNGDGSPSFADGETDDHITFYRMDNGTRTEVFHYPYNANTVNFVARPTIGGVGIVKTNDTIANATNVTSSLSSGVTGTTPSTSDNTTKVATTSFVRSAITNFNFPSGTKMLFQQTSAPTGWTKVTSGVDNKALRVVSGTAGSGGSNAFTNTLASRGINANAGNTTAGGNVSSSAGNTTAGGNVSVSVGNTAAGGNISVGNTTAGGNVSISNTSTGGTVNSHTLSVNQIPSHSHNADTKLQQHNCRGNACPGFARGNSGGNYQSATTHNTGGNGGHSHGFSGSSHSHNGSLSGNAHNHNASFSGSNHNHNASGSFSGSAHNHNVSSSFSGTAHNHSISVGNLDMAVQYLDVIVASKN